MEKRTEDQLMCIPVCRLSAFTYKHMHQKYSSTWYFTSMPVQKSVHWKLKNNIYCSWRLLTFNASTSWSQRCRFCDLQNSVLVGQALWAARALGYHQGCPDSIPGGVDVIDAGLVGSEAAVTPSTFVSHGSRRYETHSLPSGFRSVQEAYSATLRNTIPTLIALLP
jgi:hypothetical protein